MDPSPPPAESQAAARADLKDSWRNQNGRAKCPRCSKGAFNWIRRGDKLYIQCVACGNEQARRFKTDSLFGN